MRFNEFRLVETKINEASGVFNRQAGQRFYHPETDHTLEFTKVVAYPSDAEQFNSPEDRDKAVEQLNQALDIAIQWTNSPTRATLAFGLAYLEDPKSGEVAIFGRYFNKMNLAGLPANWNSSYFHGYKLQTGAAAKLQAGLTPQDILGVEEKLVLLLETMQVKYYNQLASWLVLIWVKVLLPQKQILFLILNGPNFHCIGHQVKTMH
jgi:hypothetical protein